MKDTVGSRNKKKRMMMCTTAVRRRRDLGVCVCDKYEGLFPEQGSRCMAGGLIFITPVFGVRQRPILQQQGKRVKLKSFGQVDTAVNPEALANDTFCEVIFC